ncbi:F0F1 ATP synthase subunit B [Clostridium sp. SYSU_GA19001]|uniref:F0F1 ATP synthase subunit B n=1 Tax=Clostridium caldaquaticum TaxID=2940653 RepID=UPI002077114C|nr:F0F1 ATP synthase subunit B [Clostridium caldaquaticum]MCM8711651.1 F0F1 ATP synthase subunit B [Clostridium caldaquaticum]
MEINPLTVVATIINFGIFVLVISYFFYKPVMKVISEREAEIKDKIQKSEDNLKKAEALKIENENNLKNSREEGKAIIEEFKSRAKKVSEEILEKAREEAEFILERARVDAEREKEKAQDEIKAQAVSLAMLMSSKVLETAIDEEEHRRLIKEYIDKVGI